MKRLILILLLISLISIPVSASTQILYNATNVTANLTQTWNNGTFTVNPVIQGVTSTDNIDQSLDSVWAAANTYALTNAVNEGATHIQTFTPTKTKITNISINCVATGTAVTWTLVVHDAANNILSSNTITPVAGVNSIPVPALWTTGNLHFHVYASATTGTPTLKAGTSNDLETGSYIQYYAKNTEDVDVTINGVNLGLISNGTAIGDATGILSGAIVDTDKGFYNWTSGLLFRHNITILSSGISEINYGGAFNYPAYNQVLNGWTNEPTVTTPWVLANAGASRYFVIKANTMLPIQNYSISYGTYCHATYAYDHQVSYSFDGISYTGIPQTCSGTDVEVNENANIISNGVSNSTLYVKFANNNSKYVRYTYATINATLNTTGLPTQTYINGVNYVNISSNGRAVSSPLDPSMMANVWLMAQESTAIIPVASFSRNVTGGQAPLPVLFTDTSTNRPKVWNWSVNNTDWTSRTWYNYTTSTNLVQTFITAGLYNVTLSVQNITESPQISTVQHDVRVNSTLQADFVGAPLTGYASTDVSFVDFSTGDGIYAWSWNFGDGGTSALRNPTHPYTTAGTYTVSLTITAPDGTSTKTEPAYITMGTAPNPDTGSTYSFRQGTNTIYNLTPYNRTIQMSNIVNASWANGTALFDKDYITIKRVLTNTTTFKSNTLPAYSINNATGTITFNVTNTSGFVAGTTPLSFIDIEMVYDRYTSASVTGAGWGTGSLGNGTYKVMFPVTTLTDTPLAYGTWVTHSDFTISNAAPTSGVTVVTLTPIDHTEAADRFLWNFGDGATFLSFNRTGVTHIYTGVGPVITPFSPSLTAYLSANASVTNTTTKTNGITPVYAADWVKANFTATPTVGGVGLAVVFTDLSEFGTATGKIYNWSFGDDFLSTNPYSAEVGGTSHVYTALGSYTVNLTVTSDGGTDYERKLNFVTISNQQSTTFYSPKTTAFHIVDQYGNQIKGATVTANFNQSTLPPTAVSWLTSNYGMNINAANEALNGALQMTGLSSDTGDITFVMIAALEYDITITYGGTSNHFMISPQNNFYQLKFLAAAVADNGIGNCVYANGNTHSGIARPDIGNITFMFSYQDTCGTTVAVDYYVADNDLNTMIYHYQLTPVTTGIYVNNYTVPNVRGKSYRWWQNSTRSV
jgi:PKD repeat protein